MNFKCKFKRNFKTQISNANLKCKFQMQVLFEEIYAKPLYKSFSNIAKIQKLQESLKSEKYLSKSLSIVDAMKFISQSYSNGKKSKYDLNFSKSKDQKYFSRIIKSKYFKNSFVSYIHWIHTASLVF